MSTYPLVTFRLENALIRLDFSHYKKCFIPKAAHSPMFKVQARISFPITHYLSTTQLCSCFLINPQYNRVSIYCQTLLCCFHTTQKLKPLSTFVSQGLNKFCYDVTSYSSPRAPLWLSLPRILVGYDAAKVAKASIDHSPVCFGM